ncbi:MAG: hypothetical protein JSV44_00155 [Candidatus Zixiibacteriota bacterium]|nr:MAG: hypothetical protein JSV44_00155 [candidate division Zixibacteria bacterium]
MKRSLLFAIMAFIMIAAAALANHGLRKPGASMAPCGNPRGEKPAGIGMILQAADDIGLDRKQKEKLLSMHQKFGTERIELRARLEKAQLNLRHLRMSEAPDADILAAMDKIGEIKTQQRKMRYTHRQQIKILLTQDQQDKLKELRARRHQIWRKGSHFEGHGRGPMPSCLFGSDRGR